MKKINILGFYLITMLIGTSPVLLTAQRKIYIGAEGGIGVSKVKVENTLGHNFNSHKTTKLAATGIHIGFETGNHLFLEFAVSAQTFTNHSVKTKSSYHSTAKNDIFTTSMRLRYEMRVTKMFSVFPTWAIHMNRLNQPSESYDFGSIISRGSTTSNGVTVYDSIFMSSRYHTNRTIVPEVGVDLAYTIFPRMQAYVGTYVSISNVVYASDYVTAYKTNEPITMARIKYGGNELSFKVGFRWHLANFSKVGKRVW
jgi:hypothetical protein